MNVSLEELTADAPNARALREAIAHAPARAAGDHSVLYVHTCGISTPDVGAVHAALAKVTEVLGGPITLAATSSNDFALFIEGWPHERALQVARLIRAVVQGARLAHLPGMRVSIGLLSLRGGEVDIDRLLDDAKAMCHAAERPGRDRITIVPLFDGAHRVGECGGWHG